MADDDKTRIVPDEGVRQGTQLNGIYEIDELIATGGMGEVYRGHNIQTGDPVAIKLVLKEFARDQAMLALLRKEALVLNHLSHDAIVRYHVFTIDPTINRPYLAMEYVDGQSLSERMRQGPLDPSDAYRMLTRLASGLALAHEAGIIHRDLSPDNIVLSGGNVDKTKIIDFGIARAASIGGGTLIGGSFAGKYNFVSPEQLGMFGGEVTERSDIYSLGLVIAGALRGAPLDMNGTPVEVIEKRRLRPDLSDIDPTLAPLIEAMLEPHPADRPQSAAEIVEWLREHGQPWLMPGQRALGGNGGGLPRTDRHGAAAAHRQEQQLAETRRDHAAAPARPGGHRGRAAAAPPRGDARQPAAGPGAGWRRQRRLFLRGAGRLPEAPRGCRRRDAAACRARGTAARDGRADRAGRRSARVRTGGDDDRTGGTASHPPTGSRRAAGRLAGMARRLRRRPVLCRHICRRRAGLRRDRGLQHLRRAVRTDAPGI